MVSAECFFKTFLGFFDFGRTILRLCAFMRSPSLPDQLKQTACRSNLDDATGTPHNLLSAGFLLKFDNGCVTVLGERAEKTGGNY
jgi:hypothetical protein